MEVKLEAADQYDATTGISIIKMYREMSEKFGKLQQEFVGLKKEMAELRKENAEMKKEMAKNDEKYKRQNATLKEVVAKLKGQLNHHRELGRQQHSQMGMMMENSQHNKLYDYPMIEGGAQAQYVFDETLLDQRDEQQNLDNTFDLVENVAATIIKQECKNTEIEANCTAVQMQTTTSNLNNYKEENGGNEQNNGLEEFIVGIEGLQNIEWGDEMDLDREEQNGKSENAENGEIDGQIKCAPIKSGGMLKCNWPECGFRSLYPYNMHTHWRTHTGERPFVCAECGQSFSHNSTLKRHSLIHSGQKPYRCNACGKSFRKSSQLSEHKRDHTGQKPYLCMECNKSFKTSTELRRHRQRHHGKQIGRKKCGQSYARSEDSKIHEQLMAHYLLINAYY